MFHLLCGKSIMILARNQDNSIEDQIIDWNADRQSLKLKSGLLVLDRQSQWEYYHPEKKRWMKVFQQKRSQTK